MPGTSTEQPASMQKLRTPRVQVSPNDGGMGFVGSSRML
jgi:hypothetical protein